MRFGAEAVEEKVRSFVANRSKIVGPSEIHGQTRLFSSGLLDSLSFIELVTFLELEFNIQLSGVVDVNPTLLDRVDRIVEVVLSAPEAKGR